MTHIAWVPPAVGGAGAGDVRRPGGEFYPVPDDPAPAPPDETGRPRRARLDAVLLARRRQPGLHRAGRAQAARLAGGGSGERRRPAAPPGPAGVPPLARDAAVRRPDLRAARGLVDRLVVDSREWERACTPLRAPASTSATTSPSRTSSGRARCRGARRSRRRGRASPRPTSSRCAAREADALLLAGWLRSRLDRPVALEQHDAEEIDAVSVDGEAVAEPSLPRASSGGC